MAALSPQHRKQMIAVILVRYVAIGLLTFSLVLSLINPPIIAGVLIVAVAFGSNIILRLVLRLSRWSTILYLTYVGTSFGLAGLWLSSIITTVEAAVIFLPIAIGYVVLSWARFGE